MYDRKIYDRKIYDRKYFTSTHCITSQKIENT